MHPKNIKQFITNRELPVLLKDVFKKAFGDVVEVISIFEVESMTFIKKARHLRPLLKYIQFTRICLARQFISDRKNRSDLIQRMKFSES